MFNGITNDEVVTTVFQKKEIFETLWQILIQFNFTHKFSRESYVTENGFINFNFMHKFSRENHGTQNGFIKFKANEEKPGNEGRQSA